MAQPDSICIKPLRSNFKPKPTAKYPTKRIGPTPRQAAALVASAIANGIVLSAECRIPRRLTINGASALIENGVSSDIISANMASLSPAADPRDEVFVLNQKQVNQVVALLGADKLIQFCVLRNDGQ